MADANVTMRLDPEQTRRIMDAAVARFRLDIEAIRRETWAEAVAALRDEAAARLADPTTGSTAWAVYSTAADYLETVAPAEKASTAAHRGATERRTRSGRTTGHPSTGGDTVTRYRLPAGCHVDGVGEIDACEDGPTGLWRATGNQGTVVYFPRDVLTEVAPPIPDEPEPGAYLINDDTVAERRGYVEVPERWLVAGDKDWLTWPMVMAEYGGPDVSIRRLVPDPVQDVRLPWRCGDLHIRRLGATKLSRAWNAGLVVEVNVQDRWVRLDADEARQAAAALLAAAEAQDD